MAENINPVLGNLAKDTQATGDMSQETDKVIACADTMAKAGRIEEGIENILALEEQTRTTCDEISTSKLMCAVCKLYYEANEWGKLCEHIAMLSEKPGQVKRGISDMVLLFMSWLEKLDKKKKLELNATLSTVTDGKLVCEVEKARLLLLVSSTKEEEGNIDEAANLLQDKTENASYILNQKLLAMKDFVRTQITSKKLNPKLLNDEDFQDMKAFIHRKRLESIASLGASAPNGIKEVSLVRACLFGTAQGPEEQNMELRNEAGKWNSRLAANGDDDPAHCVEGLKDTSPEVKVEAETTLGELRSRDGAGVLPHEKRHISRAVDLAFKVGKDIPRFGKVVTVLKAITDSFEGCEECKGKLEKLLSWAESVKELREEGSRTDNPSEWPSLDKVCACLEGMQKDIDEHHTRSTWLQFLSSSGLKKRLDEAHTNMLQWKEQYDSAVGTRTLVKVLDMHKKIGQVHDENQLMSSKLREEFQREAVLSRSVIEDMHDASEEVRKALDAKMDSDLAKNEARDEQDALIQTSLHSLSSAYQACAQTLVDVQKKHAHDVSLAMQESAEKDCVHQQELQQAAERAVKQEELRQALAQSLQHERERALALVQTLQHERERAAEKLTAETAAVEAAAAEIADCRKVAADLLAAAQSVAHERAAADEEKIQALEKQLLIATNSAEKEVADREAAEKTAEKAAAEKAVADKAKVAKAEQEAAKALEKVDNARLLWNGCSGTGMGGNGGELLHRTFYEEAREELAQAEKRLRDAKAEKAQEELVDKAVEKVKSRQHTLNQALLKDAQKELAQAAQKKEELARSRSEPCM